MSVQAPRPWVKGLCESCQEPVARGGCRAERFGAIVGRAGWHGGCCWGGRFPTLLDVVDERRRLREIRERGPQVQPDIPIPEHQLELPL
jgi:hypothetical protein